MRRPQKGCALSTSVDSHHANAILSAVRDILVTNDRVKALPTLGAQKRDAVRLAVVERARHLALFEVRPEPFPTNAQLRRIAFNMVQEELHDALEAAREDLEHLFPTESGD